MKIHILFEIADKPSGGGNQFLRALRKYFYSAGVYEDNAAHADIILFNSYQNIDNVARVKLKYQNKLFVHRIDGPIRLYNKFNDKRDGITNTANRLIAEATVFQSEWSRRENYKLGLKENCFEKVIINSPDSTIFNHKGKMPFSSNRKMRVVATSWSSNWKKGFEVYKWLDNNLDFSKYEMTFIGSSPIAFKNIRHIEPVNSRNLAEEIKKNDVFLTASQNDPCSNSLIEALHCGLPAIALREGGHPEIIGDAGETFRQVEEIPKLLEKIKSEYNAYQKKINLPQMEQIGEQYLKFIEYVFHQKQNNLYRFKHFNRISYMRTISTIYYWKLSEYASGFLRKSRKLT